MLMKSDDPSISRTPDAPFAAFFLLITALLALVSSHLEPLRGDEFGLQLTDSVSSFARLIQVQRRTPVSLDPIVSHLLGHLSLDVFGHSDFALRLPSLAGYLAMQVCLFLFLRRAAGQRAAVIATALSIASGPMIYGSMARPYGVLLGLCGILALSWQAATRSSDQPAAHRWRPLLVLCLSLALALNTHYYAVLLLIPLYGAELFRSIERRRMDLPLQLALLFGVAGLLFALPFMGAAARFRQHYYMQFTPDLHFLSHAYLWLVTGNVPTSPTVQRILLASLVLLAVAGIWLQRRRNEQSSLPKAEFVFLALLAALPFFGYLMAWKVTHVFEVRFLVCAAFGVDAVLAIGMARAFTRRFAYGVLIAALMVLTLGLGVANMAAQARARSELSLHLTLPPQTTSALSLRPGLPIYLFNPVEFLDAEFYSPDLQVRSRLAMVYSFSQEIRSSGTDTVSLTNLHLKSMSSFNIQTYEAIKAQGGEHLFVLSPYEFDWLHVALAEDHATIQQLGPAYGGELVSASFPAR